MSEDMTKVTCAQCGGENPADSKFCSSCGATIEQAATDAGVFSGEETSAYEKVTDAEVITPETSETTQSSYTDTYTTEPQYHTEPVAEKTTNGNIGFSIASLVCGILSLLCCCLSVLSLILGIVAIVLGIITITKKYDGKGMAIAGIVVAGIGVCIWLVGLIFSGTALYSQMTNELLNELY